MKFKFGAKQITLLSVAAILLAIIIAGNYYLVLFAHVLHEVFGGKGTVGGGQAGGSHAGESAFNYVDRVVRETAEDSIVLLKNDIMDDGEAYLPRPVDTKFNLFGYGATDDGFLLVGGGSGGTNITAEKQYRVTLREAFEEAHVLYNETLYKAYDDFSDFDADFRSGGSTNAKDGYRAAENPGESFYTASLLEQARGYSQDAVVVLCRWGNENGGATELKSTGTYTGGTYLELTDNEKLLFSKLEEGGYNVTVLLNTTNPIEMSFLDDYTCIKACMYVGVTGQSGAVAIPELLIGMKTADGVSSELSPSGRLSDTFANDWQSFAPSYPNAANGSSNIAYQEGIYVGYKWYETAAAEGVAGFDYDKVIRYPFGYGLSYTTFTQTMETSWRDGEELSADKEYSVTVTVKNVGNFAAKDVVQLYYTPEYYEGGIEKASINLLAFGKTGVIAPNETERVTLTFTAYDLAAYDDYDNNHNKFTGYEAEKGRYDIKLMQDAHTLYGNEQDCVRTLTTSEGIKFERDPFTGAEVKNLFTGEDAYAGMPIDGSKGLNSKVEYLSRANHFENLDKMAQIAPQNSLANDAAEYDYDGYDTEKADEVAAYAYGEDNGIYLTTMEDGSKPSMDALSGSGAALTISREYLIPLVVESNPVYWEYLLNQLTQSEIVSVIGNGYFGTIAVESIGKPRNVDRDGPAGFNKNVTAADIMNDYPVLPAEALSGCSWNINIMREIGRAQGKVSKVAEEPVQGWYAPGVNLHRSPYNSRNYEYFSEDGVLSGWLAAGIICGAKEEDLYCYLKHFALAESGENSKNWFEWCTEQTLREIYCKPFEIAVKVSIEPGTGRIAKDVKVSYDAAAGELVVDRNGRPQTGANAVMGAFNKIGAVWSGYNHALLTTMLREEWGFQGSVITDWYETGNYMNDFDRAVKAGNNLWLGKDSVGINFNDAGEAYGARQSIKGILYTYLDTLYVSGTETAVAAAEPYSPLFAGLWAGLDILLGLGFIACVVFAFVPLKKKS